MLWRLTDRHLRSKSVMAWTLVGDGEALPWLSGGMTASFSRQVEYIACPCRGRIASASGGVHHTSSCSDPQYEPVKLARAAREAILRANGCSAGIGVGHSRVVARWATRRAKPSGDGVHFTPLERVLEAFRLSTVQLQNTFGTTLGARIAAMV